MKQENNIASSDNVKEGFTGGKWRVNNISIESSQGWHIANINPFAPETSNSEANARLIAEAKNMYQLIKRFSETAEFLNGNMPVAFRNERKEAKAILNRINS
jgi:hypothetical protein